MTNALRRFFSLFQPRRLFPSTHRPVARRAPHRQARLSAHALHFRRQHIRRTLSLIGAMPVLRLF
jgi:hypothetical protein